MFKTVILLKRRPGLSKEAFIDHYEKRHRIIGEKYLSGRATHYERRYLSNSPNPVTGETVESEYDVLTETWYPDRQAFEATMQMLCAKEILAEIAEDEERFQDRSKNRFFIVDEEHGSTLGPSTG